MLRAPSVQSCSICRLLHKDGQPGCHHQFKAVSFVFCYPRMVNQAADAALAAAKDAHKRGDAASAEAGYRQVLLQAPQHADALHLLGALLVEAHTCVATPGAATEGVCSKCADARAASVKQTAPAADGLGKGASSVPAHKEPVIIDLLKVEEGLKYLRVAINAKPANPRFRRSLGVALQRLGLLEDAVDAFEHATSKDPTDMTSWLHAARAFKQLGTRARAAEAYMTVARIQPDHPTAHYSAACCLRQVGRRADAVQAFRRHLELVPDHQEAKFWVAALTGDAATVAAAPPDLVAGLFDSYADNFDKHLVEQLAYRTPWLLTSTLLDAVKDIPATDGTKGTIAAAPPWQRAVDLGCGTGLMGPLLAPHMAPDGRLEGVDLSAGMVAKARSRDCYQELQVDDLLHYLTTSTAAQGQWQQAYQLVVAADVFVYIGDLQPVMAAAAKCCKPGALFGFSTEAADETGANAEDTSGKGTELGYRLTPTGRFAHSEAYLRSALQATGWQVLTFQHTVIRHNVGRPVHGYLTVAMLN